MGGDHNIEPRRLGALLASVAVIVVGAIVCTLWAFGIPQATQLVPDSSAVRFSTGLCFILGGTSLLMVGRRPRWALAAVVPMALLTGATLLGYLLGRDLAIASLFIAGPALPNAGPMAPNTAVALFVAALALAMLVPGRSRIWALSISGVLAALTTALGLVAMLGYAFDLRAAFEWAGLTRMALLTATTLVVLGVGIILTTREVGRVASWIELPWLASSAGVGAIGLGLLAVRALGVQVQGLTPRLMHGLDVAAILFALLFAGTVAQARHMRLLTLRLAAANRRQAEQSAELADSKQRLQLLIDSLQAAVVVHGGDSAIEFANPRAAKLLGLTCEQMLGRTAIDPSWHFVREDGSPMPVEDYPVSRVIQSGQALRDYVVGVHVAEQEPIRWVLVDAVPTMGKDGRLRQVIVSFIDISELQHKKQDLAQQAATDTLTGLATRRHLLELAQLVMARARRSGAPLAVIVLDVDRFKSVNDRFGHETGDRLLRGLADVLHLQLREVDLASRWGGEEFCVLLPDTDARAAAEVAERLRAAIEAMPFAAPDGTAIPVTASFGVAISRRGTGGFERLVDAADHAMYEAKRTGRNRVCTAPATPDGAARVPEA